MPVAGNDVVEAVNTCTHHPVRAPGARHKKNSRERCMCALGHTVWPPEACVFFRVCGPLPSRIPSPIGLTS